MFGTSQEFVDITDPVGRVEGTHPLRITSPLTNVEKWGEDCVFDRSVSYSAHCPCCWRPIECKRWFDAWKPPPTVDVGNSRYAYVVVVGAIALGAIALSHLDNPLELRVQNTILFV